MDNLSDGLNDDTQEKKCIFEGEHYSVRDNGAILRHTPEGKRARANDNQWTFGKENPENGYLHLSSVRIHRIVATAFHGDPPDPKYVVDHIDSNRKNNRPENLRWLTRLENSLQNPVTRKKIEYLCGSIEAFLENPSMLNEHKLEPNYSWMRTVTKEEAQNCKNRMAVWASQENKKYRPSTYRSAFNNNASFEKRVYKPLNRYEAGFGREPGLDISKTLWAATYMFAPSYFPQCPEFFKSDRLEEYFLNIKGGEVFAYTEKYEQHPEFYFSSKVLATTIQKEQKTITVLCERTDSRYGVVGIELYDKNQWFIHYNLGVYTLKETAEQRFIEAQKLSADQLFNEGYKHSRD